MANLNEVEELRAKSFSPLEMKYFRVITEHGRHWTWFRNLIAYDMDDAMRVVRDNLTADVSSVTVSKEGTLEEGLRNYEIRTAGYDPTIATPYQLQTYQGVQCRDIRTPPEPQAIFFPDPGENPWAW